MPEVATVSSSAASSSSCAAPAEVHETSEPCVWCLRFGVRVAPESSRCVELQKDFGCHRCDKVGCWSQNRQCAYFGRARPLVADATTTGRAAAHMFERAPVRIDRRHKRRILVEFSGRHFVKGAASGIGCNCLIHTLLSCLNDNNLRCVANVPWIRQELQKLFPDGENIVTKKQFPRSAKSLAQHH